MIRMYLIIIYDINETLTDNIKGDDLKCIKLQLTKILDN